jgi:hypothetical protein
MEEPVTGLRKLLFVMIFTFTFIVTGTSAVAATAAANNIYFAQTSQGANSGADCADAYAYNDGSNGINASKYWVAGNTLHICGTISVGAGAGGVSAQGSGSSGSPITVKFEPGAVLQAPYFGTGGLSGIVLSGHNYITVDGGNTSSATAGTVWTTGIIQNYANGTSGTSVCAGINDTYTAACTSQVFSSTLIEAMNSSNITIQNLSVSNGYLETTSDSMGGGPGSTDGIHFQGSNFTITNDQIHDDGLGIDNTEYGTDPNTDIAYTYFSEDGWALGCAGGTNAPTNYQFHDNWLHNFDRWTNGAGATHVNGIHCYGSSSGGIQQLYLYNNRFDGNMGGCCWTAWVYLESDSPAASWAGSNGTLYAWNNIFFAPSSCCVNGNGMMNAGYSKGQYFYNNVFYGTAAQDGPCLGWGGSGTVIENNVFENCGQAFTALNGYGPVNPGFTTIDYNIYANLSSGNPVWSVQTTNAGNITTSSFSTWQTDCGCDAHSQAQLGSSLANITTEGAPSAGYVGIEKGANLTSLATGNLAALAFDTSAGNTRTPVQRPGGTCSTQGTSSCWDIGAYQYAAGDPPPAAPAAPTGLSAVVQ